MTNNKEVQSFVDSRIKELLPIVQSAEKAIEKFYESPSIKNGSYMGDMRTLSQKAIDSIGKILWSEWRNQFHMTITEDEYTNMIEDSLRRLRPEGEGDYWVSRVVPEIRKDK